MAALLLWYEAAACIIDKPITNMLQSHSQSHPSLSTQHCYKRESKSTNGSAVQKAERDTKAAGINAHIVYLFYLAAR